MAGRALAIGRGGVRRRAIRRRRSSPGHGDRCPEDGRSLAHRVCAAARCSPRPPSSTRAAGADRSGASAAVGRGTAPAPCAAQGRRGRIIRNGHRRRGFRLVLVGRTWAGSVGPGNRAAAPGASGRMDRGGGAADSGAQPRAGRRVVLGRGLGAAGPRKARPGGSGSAWWRVGDSALALDPLSGQGVYEALRGARLVAAAIQSVRTGGDAARARRFVTERQEEAWRRGVRAARNSMARTAAAAPSGATPPRPMPRCCPRARCTVRRRRSHPPPIGCSRPEPCGRRRPVFPQEVDRVDRCQKKFGDFGGRVDAGVPGPCRRAERSGRGGARRVRNWCAPTAAAVIRNTRGNWSASATSARRRKAG